MYCVFKASVPLHRIVLAFFTFVLCEQYVVICLSFYCRVKYDDDTKKNSALILNDSTVDSDMKGYITAFRGIVVLFTYRHMVYVPNRCIVILAVDFPIFPRKYAKTYLNGYSLVSVVVAVDDRVDGHRCWPVHRYQWHCCSYEENVGIGLCIDTSDIMAFLKRQMLLLIIGFSRLLFMRCCNAPCISPLDSGYVINVVEYGRDWNFFFTLFFVFFAGFVLVNFVKSSSGLALVAVGILAYYQFLLWFGLAEYAFPVT